MKSIIVPTPILTIHPYPLLAHKISLIEVYIHGQYERGCGSIHLGGILVYTARAIVERGSIAAILKSVLLPARRGCQVNDIIRITVVEIAPPMIIKIRLNPIEIPPGEGMVHLKRNGLPPCSIRLKRCAGSVPIRRDHRIGRHSGMRCRIGPDDVEIRHCHGRIRHAPARKELHVIPHSSH